MHAPIVLVVYNRPIHTIKTLEALSKNELADESILYIFVDGPKESAKDTDYIKIAEVDRVIRSKQWCKETIIVKRVVNMGLADNIIDSVTQVVNEHGSVIVLEDDIVTSVGFLKYMNDALVLYKDQEQVMHISGYMFPVKGRLPETFFYKQTSCWGWATWKRAWDKLEANPTTLLSDLIKSNKISECNIDGTDQFLNQLYSNINGRLKTWAVKWQFSVILNNGLCLHPRESLVNNVGLDGSGQNSGVNLKFEVNLAEFVSVKKIPVCDNKNVYSLLRKFHQPKVLWLNKFKIRFNKLLPLRVSNGLRIIMNHNFREKIFEENRLRQFPRYTTAYTTFFGNRICVPDTASYLFTKEEIFTDQIYFFESTISNPYIIDCGANIGLSVIFFKKLFPGAEIIAFEPDKNIFEALSKNIAAFAFDNVTLINKGLWNEEKTLYFSSEGADAGRVVGIQDKNLVGTIEATRLRHFLQRPVDFLKIDIEGAETRVLKDCADLLKNVKNVFVEYHSYLGEDQTLDELLYILRHSGFRYTIQQHGVVSKNPFIKVQDQNGMDILLNISAFRNYQ